MGLGAIVATALWAMLPAYVPNNAAVLGSGGRPINGGRTWGGRRVLGDGKTWRGTLVGTAAGTALEVGLNAVSDPVGQTIGISLPVFRCRLRSGWHWGRWSETLEPPF